MPHTALLWDHTHVKTASLQVLSCERASAIAGFDLLLLEVVHLEELLRRGIQPPFSKHDAPERQEVLVFLFSSPPRR